MTSLNHPLYKDCSPYIEVFQPVVLIYYGELYLTLSHRRHCFYSLVELGASAC